MACSSKISRNTNNRRHLKGGHLCEDSNHYLLQQHCSQAWLWRRRLAHRFPLPSVFRMLQSILAFLPSAHGAITKPRLTAARPEAFMGPGTSTTASSWASDPGLAGATLMAGAGIVSSRMAAEGITAALAMRPSMAILPTATMIAATATRMAKQPIMAVQLITATQPIMEAANIGNS